MSEAALSLPWMCGHYVDSYLLVRSIVLNFTTGHDLGDTSLMPSTLYALLSPSIVDAQYSYLMHLALRRRTTCSSRKMISRRLSFLSKVIVFEF